MNLHQPLGPDPAGLLFRHVFEERARRLFAPGARVLDVGQGANEADGRFDGAFAGPGVLDDADLVDVGRSLAAALRSGAAVLICLPRPRSRPGPGLREARSRLGPDFRWHGAFALGVLVPGPSRREWSRAHPQAFGILAAAESVLRRWPLLRGLGRHAVLEGVRR